MSKRAEEKAREYEYSLDYYHYTSDNPSLHTRQATSRPKQKPSRGPANGCSRILQSLWITTMRTFTSKPTDRSL